MTETRTIEKLLRQQAALANFGSFAFWESDLQKILTEAAEICAQSLGVPYAKICRYRAAQNDLLVEAGCGWQGFCPTRVPSCPLRPGWGTWSSERAAVRASRARPWIT